MQHHHQRTNKKRKTFLSNIFSTARASLERIIVIGRSSSIPSEILILIYQYTNTHIRLLLAKILKLVIGRWSCSSTASLVTTGGNCLSTINWPFYYVGEKQESSSSNWISTRAPETFHLPIQRFVFEALGGLPWTICISMTQFNYFAIAPCDKYVNELIAQNINQVLWSGHSLRQLCGNLEEKLILMLMIDTTRNGKLSRMSMIS